MTEEGSKSRRCGASSLRKLNSALSALEKWAEAKNMKSTVADKDMENSDLRHCILPLNF